MTHTPRFKRGDLVRIPQVNAGHDHHDPVRAYTINKVYVGADAQSTSYSIKSLTGLYPETRLSR